MSLLLNQPSKLCFRKPLLVRSSPHLSDGIESLSLPFHSYHSHSCALVCADPCGGNRGYASTRRSGSFLRTISSLEEWEEVSENDSKVMTELGKEMGAIGSCCGWLPTLKDGVLRLREMNINSETDPKRILLPPLVTLPHCQTQYVTNVAMSSYSPQEEDCVLAVKFLGPQLSFCRPALSNSEWVNIRMTDTCFFSSPVMYSKKDDMFRIAGSGGHLVGSWDLHNPSNNPKLQSLRFQNLPKLSETKRDLLDSCYTTEHLVESVTSTETFMVKSYKRTAEIIKGIPRKKTEAVMVFKLDEEQGNAVYTPDLVDQSIFLNNSEALCVPLSSPRCFGRPNFVRIRDVDEDRMFKLTTEQEWDC